MQHLPAKNHVFRDPNHVFRGPEGARITRNRRKSPKRCWKKAARTKCVEIWFSGVILGDFGVKRGGCPRGCFLWIFLKSHDFSEIFSTLIFPLKLSGISEDFTIFGPFGAFFGPSGPLFSWFLDGRCCIFEKITFLPSGAAPYALFPWFLRIFLNS